MDGLYFYKLVSPYKEDVTKDCKLTVNEIDHNFVTLKDADIKDISFDDSTNIITLTRKNCDTLTCSLNEALSGMTKNLTVDYDSVEGVITITHNGQKYTINKLLTQDNLSGDVMTKVATDGTIEGTGTKNSPIGIAELSKTGQVLPAFEMIDVANGEFMPKADNVHVGDRVVTRESLSDYGYLYNYKAVQLINEELTGGWRVPTKDDWDNMLNAIEPCDKYRTHNSATANRMLGKYAGKLLKSINFWLSDEECEDECGCTQTDENGVLTDTEKKINAKGTDAYGMGIMPAGYHDSCDVVEYFGKRGYYWANTQISETDVYVKQFDYDKSGVVQHVESPRSYFSLRLVKDYDGSNYKETAVINGETYETALMPALNTQFGESIWTTTNVAFSESRYNPICPNYCQGVSKQIVYYVNEWNGTDWDKKRMYEGDSIVLLKGFSGETSQEYRIINGVLTSVSEELHSRIISEIEEELDEIREVIGSGFTDEYGETVSLTDKIIEDEKILDETIQELSAETIAREEEDIRINERIDVETTLREEGDEALSGAISALTDVVEFEVNRLDERIDEVSEDLSGLTEDVAELSALTETVIDSVGLTKDGEYIPSEDAKYINSASTIAEAIEILDNVETEQDSEIEELSATCEALAEEIDNEREERISADTALSGAIDTLDEKVAELSATCIELSGDIETEREERISADTALYDSQISLDGTQHNLDVVDGSMTFKTNGGDDIRVEFSSNYGELPELN